MATSIHALLSQIAPLSVSGDPGRAIWSLWTDTPHRDSALQRALKTPFCVYRLRTVSLLISQHLMTTEHENRNANVTLWVRGKDCPAFLWAGGLWGEWKCTHTVRECHPWVFPQSALRGRPGTGGLFVQVQFWKTTWHSYNVMQMYALIQCQWLLSLPGQATHILIIETVD